MNDCGLRRRRHAPLRRARFACRRAVALEPSCATDVSSGPLTWECWRSRLPRWSQAERVLRRLGHGKGQCAWRFRRPFSVVQRMLRAQLTLLIEPCAERLLPDCRRLWIDL